MKKRLLSVALTIALATVILSGCGSGGTTDSKETATTAMQAEAKTIEEVSEPVYGGILYIDDTGNKAVLGYPGKSLSASIIRHVAPCIETLLRYDADGNPQPFLLDSYEIDLDNMTMTFHVKKGINFHDGTLFNAEAVKWNFEQQIESGNSYFDNFESMEVQDEYTLVAKLKVWNNELLTNLCSYAGMMISPTACMENGVEWAVNNPVGTGAFKFVRWEKDVKIVYEKNENYWQEGLPYLDGIELSFTADDTSRELSLRNGDLDALIQGNTTNAISLEADGYLINKIPAGSIGYSLYMSSADPNSPWASLEVRQAIAHAINKEAIVENIMDGLAMSTNQFSYKGHWGYNDEVVGYPYDVEKAKSLLTDAGYGNGIETEMIYNASSDNVDLVSTAIQAMLQEVGITVTLKPVEDAAFNEYMRGGTEWDGLLMTGGFAQPDTAQQMNLVINGNGYYVSAQRFDKFVSLLPEVMLVSTQEEKRNYVHQIEKILIDEYCYNVPLFVSYDLTILAPYVHDSGLSQGMPATIWTPERTWLSKK